MKARRKRISKPKAPSRMEREDARRFAANVSTTLLVVGAIVALVVVANRWARKEETRGVRIIGRTILDSAEVMRSAAIPEGIPVRSINLEEIEKRVRTHPFIAHASVYHGENGMLTVEIIERAPVAVTLIDGAPLYIDSLGRSLPYRFSSAAFDLPVITGILSDTPPPARKGTTADVDSLRAREALDVLGALKGYDEALYRQISEIRRESGGEYTLVTADRAIPIKAGLPSDLPGRLKKLDLFLTSVLAVRGADEAISIDLRWKGQVVARWRDAQAIEG